jgi:predicted XRE-type DNA-binding protein
MNSIDTSITHITLESDNIFEDLGFNSQEATKLKIKAQLMCQISEWIKEKQLKQEDASHLLHVTRPRVSDIMRGKSGKFTIDALIDMLERTGKHVTVHVS